MPQIWDNTPAYLLTKRYVVWAFKQYYNQVIINGSENLPQSGPVIFAPNHLNALMDALAVLSLPPHGLPKVFLARADLFRLPAAVVRFIRFAKILPAYRIRDGYDQLDRNKETFEEAEKTLLNRSAIGIMPEGNQGEERNIRQLVKGIFRIAFSAQQKIPDGMSVKIIPIGIEYGDITEYQRSLIINIGAPVDVADYMQLFNDNQVKATNELKSTLRNALESLTVHLPAGENYPMYDSLVELLAPVRTAKSHRKGAQALFLARQQIAERLQISEIQDPQGFTQLKELYTEFSELARRLQLPARKASRPFVPRLSPLQIRLKIILLSVLLLPGAFLNYLPYRLITSVPQMAGIKYSGFFSSVYYGAAIVVLPVYYLLLAVLAISISSLTWWSIFMLIPLFYLSGKLSFRLYRCIRDLRTDLQMHACFRHSREAMNRLMELRNQLIEKLG